PSDEDLENVKTIEAAANKVLEDQRDEDALDMEEAWLEANARQELDAYATKREAAPVERLRKIITAKRALEDLRRAIRDKRKNAANVAAASAIFRAPTTGDEERHEIVARLTELRIAVQADRREEQLSLERYKKAKAALGADAFGGKTK
ncbi:MAG: hypothetical protein ACAI25_10520, partial [Planctomycetota bacterium]